MPWEQHLLLFVEGILAVSSPSLWTSCAKCVGCCAQRECGCPLLQQGRGIIQVTCKALGEAALLKLICLQALPREKKRWIKVRIGSPLDPVCRVILVSGCGLGEALDTAWHVHAAQ